MEAFSTLTLLAVASFARAEGGERLAPEPTVVANSGQWHEGALARMGMGRAAVWVTDDGWTLDLHGERRGVALEFHIEGGAPPELELEEPTEARQHYFLGDDPTRWVSNLTPHRRARLREIRPGVDLVLRTEAGGFEYDFDLRPGTDLSALVLEVRGSDGLRVDENGRLVVATELGDVLQSPPRTFVLDERGGRRPVESEVVLLGERRFGFRVPEWDGSAAVTIDPGLEWSTFLGAGDADTPTDIVLDPLGRTIVSGTTFGFDFPASPGAYDIVLDGLTDVFVTCLSHGGAGYLWSTFLGGLDGESAAGLVVADSREILVGGETRSNDFPTTGGAFDTTHAGSSDVFVARLERDGSALLASTLLGSSGSDVLGDMVFDANGALLLAGATNSPAFPTTPGTVQGSFVGGPFSAGDAFVARMDSGLGTLMRSTFLGGTGSDSATAIALQPNGDRIRVAGVTSAANFPTLGAVDATFNGPTDGFLCELDTTLGFFTWSTYVGGGADDAIRSLVTRSNGDALVGGWTDSSDFPATTFQLQSGGGRDAFVASYAANGSALGWSTLLGGAGEDELFALREDSTGRPVAVGSTDSRFFPITRWGFQAWFRGPYPAGSGAGDGWMTRLEADGSALAYGTFLGGNSDDRAYALALADDDSCRIAGETRSFNFPTTLGAVDRVLDFSGFGDAFICAIDYSRYPFTYGAGKTTSIFATPFLLWSGFPGLSNGEFRVSIEEACPNTGMGALYVSSSPAQLPQGNGTLYIGTPVRRAASTTLGLFGSGTMTLAVEPWMVGRTLYYQFVFQDPGAGNGIGLSEGLEVTFHP